MSTTALPGRSRDEHVFGNIDPTPVRTIDGLKIRRAEHTGGSPDDPVVLLTCPWPESLYAFAPMWNVLAERARLFAVDLPGFGASQRRDELLSPRGMSGFLTELLDEVGLARVHVVAPDVGTSAALFAAAAHPDRFSSVIVGTGAAAVPLQLGEPLASWVLLLPRITNPVTVINGRNDRVVRVGNAELLDARLPNSRVVIVDGGHFIWEEARAQYASVVLDSIADGWKEKRRRRRLNRERGETGTLMVGSGAEPVESAAGCSAGDACRQLALAAGTLVGVYLAVFGPGVLTSIRVIAGAVALQSAARIVRTREPHSPVSADHRSIRDPVIRSAN